MPVRYIGKTLQFQVLYGFRIEIYDMHENLVQPLGASGRVHDRITDSVHYEPITPPVSTSIPQIRRNFTARLQNGQRYLDVAGRKFDQPTYYARKILLLADLYDDQILDCFIGYCVDHDKMDLASLKEILRDYNAGRLSLDEKEEADPSNTGTCKEDPALTRECSYYEENAMREECR